jgi:hypothetical protein
MQGCAEQLSVVADSQMQKFVGNHVILEIDRLRQQVARERDPSLRGTGSPFARHSLDTDLRRTYAQPIGPINHPAVKRSAVHVAAA